MPSKDDARELDGQAVELDIFSEEFESVAGGVGDAGGNGGDDEEGGSTVYGARMWQALWLYNRDQMRNQK